MPKATIGKSSSNERSVHHSGGEPWGQWQRSRVISTNKQFATKLNAAANTPLKLIESRTDQAVINGPFLMLLSPISEQQNHEKFSGSIPVLEPYFKSVIIASLSQHFSQQRNRF